MQLGLLSQSLAEADAAALERKDAAARFGVWDREVRREVGVKLDLTLWAFLGSRRSTVSSRIRESPAGSLHQSRTLTEVVGAVDQTPGNRWARRGESWRWRLLATMWTNALYETERAS
jgi:hypothetical protein